jgi:hypothetical protein
VKEARRPQTLGAQVKLAGNHVDRLAVTRREHDERTRRDALGRFTARPASAEPITLTTMANAAVSPGFLIRITLRARNKTRSMMASTLTSSSCRRYRSWPTWPGLGRHLGTLGDDTGKFRRDRLSRGVRTRYGTAQVPWSNRDSGTNQLSFCRSVISNTPR